MSDGVIYYNVSTGCLARLAVSIYSLRKVYGGNLSVLSDGDESNDMLNKYFAKDSSLEVNIVESNFSDKSSKNHHYLSKCLMHKHTPYDKSIFLDADTVVLKDFSDAFAYLDDCDFAVPQFSTWRSDGNMISKRIREWAKIKPDYIQKAVSFGPAINTGMMVFSKKSEFMNDWYDVAVQGKHQFIPDETSCQLLLHRYSHKIIPWYYNASCKYDDIKSDSVRVIHYHGRKHCREGLIYNGDIWAKWYNEVVSKNIAGINDWTPAGDRKLKYQLSLSGTKNIDIGKN